MSKSSNFQIKIATPLICALIIVLTGCTPAKLVNPPDFSSENKSEVKVHRKSSFNAGGMTAVFGANDQDYRELYNDGVETIDLPAGDYEFFVRSEDGDKPFKLSAHTLFNQTLCFEITPRSSGTTTLNMILPFTIFMTHTFTLAETNCTPLAAKIEP